MAEERKLPIELDLLTDRAEAKLEQLENSAKEGFQIRSALNPNRNVGPQFAATAEQQRLADRLDTAYENRLVADRERVRRQQDSVHERVERNWDNAGLARQRADERAANANAGRVERSWDQASLATERIENRRSSQALREVAREHFRSEEEAETRGIQREADEFYRASGGGDEGGGSIANRMRGGGPPRGRGQPRKSLLGLRMGRLAQYISAGFVGRELLNVGQAYEARDTALALAENSLDPLAVTKAQQQFVQSIAQVPLFGQGADLFATYVAGPLFGNATSKDVALAQQSAQMGQLGVQAMVQRFSGRNEAGADLRSAMRMATAGGITTGAERSIAELNAKQENFEDSQRTQYQNMMAAANAASTPAARDLALQQARDFQKQSQVEIQARQIQTNNEINAVRRDVSLQVVAEQSKRGGLRLAAIGQMGQAEEEDFSAGLTQAEREAYSKSEDLGDETRQNNELRRAARREENTERVRRLQSRGRVMQALLSRRADQAELEENEENRRVALRDARTPDEEAQINSNASAQAGLITRRYGEEQNLNKFNLQAQLEAAQLRAQGKEKTANAEDIRNETFSQATQAMMAGGPNAKQNYQTIIQTGIAREQAYQRQLQFELYGGTFGQGIGEGGIGPGMLSRRPREEQITEGMQGVEAAIKDLQAALTGTQP